MPIDLEMLMSASNHPFFSYSAFYGSDYDDDTYDRGLAFPQRRCRPQTIVKNQGFCDGKSLYGTLANNLQYKPKEGTVSTELSYGVRKKKVSFADDCGFNLVEVREIPGAPKWADNVLTLLIGSSKRSVVKEKKWKIAFEHPPWPDEQLVEMLEKNMVALECIFVQEQGSDDILRGTIKVKNLAFEKDVFLRVTFDRWLSYTDVPCSYMKSNEASVKPNKYDTFYFNVKISPVASRYEVIEFCVCFNCSGNKYWDNNGGINYRLIVEYLKNGTTDLQQVNNRTSSETLPFTYFDTCKNTPQVDVLSKYMETEASVGKSCLHRY